ARRARPRILSRVPNRVPAQGYWLGRGLRAVGGGRGAQTRAQPAAERQQRPPQLGRQVRGRDRDLHRRQPGAARRDLHRAQPGPASKDAAMTVRLIDVSHTVEHGMVTYKGLPAPIICDYLSREASRALYAPGTEFHIGRIDLV